MGDGAATNMRFLTKPFNGNPTVALTIDQSQNATFAGGVTVNSGHVNIDAGLSYQWDDSHERIEQSDGNIEFFTNNSQAMTLNGSNLGIGITGPGASLHVDHSSSTAYNGAAEILESVIIRNKNGTDNSGVNNVASLGLQVADGATLFTPELSVPFLFLIITDSSISAAPL
jgi:hypothetical protein